MEAYQSRLLGACGLKPARAGGLFAVGTRSEAHHHRDLRAGVAAGPPVWLLTEDLCVWSSGDADSKNSSPS